MKTLTTTILALVSTLGLLLAQDAADRTIKQKNKEFSHKEITIAPGEKLVFQNDDDVTHNVFSVSKVNAFTIKVQKPSESSTVEFKEEGVTEVRCAIHPRMKLLVTVKKK